MNPDPQQVVTALIVVAAMVGLVAGAFLGLNGFAQPATPTLPGQSPRIKNLVWLVSGFLPVLVADVQKLGLPEKTSMFWPAVAYEVCGLIGALFAVVWIFHSLRSSCEHLNRSLLPEFTLDPGRYLREYLTYGRARAEEKLTADAAASRAAATAQTEQREAEARRRNAELEAGARRRTIEAQADLGAAKCVYGVMKFVTQTKAQRANNATQITEAIISAIINQILAMTGLNLRLSGSFMLYVEDQNAPVALKQRAMFTTDPPAPANGYLELRHGGGVANQRIILPVARDYDRLLPGAPAAVFALGAATMNLSQIEFRPGVPQQVQADIEAYFKRPTFKGVESVTSIAVQDGTAVRGVLNIESSARDLLGQDMLATELMIARLHTLVALLSVVPA
jgi:hypothetical protein